MIENNETSNQASQKTSETGRVVYKGVKSFSKSKAGKAAAELGKEALMWLFKSLGALLASLSLPMIIAIIAIVLVATTLFSFSLNGSFNYDEADKKNDIFKENNILEFGTACSNESSDTYNKIENNYKAVVGKARDEIKDYYLTDTIYDEVKTALNSLTISYENNMPIFSSHISGKKVISETEEHEYEVNINLPMNSNVDKQLIDTIVGYIQANYGAANLFTGDELKDINDSTVQKKFKSLKFGDLTPDTKEVMDEQYCKNVEGRIRKERSGNYCDYFYTPAKIENIVSGTCEYNNGSWENKGSVDHDCNNEEWAKTKNKKKKNDKETSPKDGDTYKYTTVITVDNTKNPLENFKLDNYKKEIEKYIDSGKLFYYNSEKLKSELKSNVEIKKEELKDKEEKRQEVKYIYHTCKYNASIRKWKGSDYCSTIDEPGTRNQTEVFKEEIPYEVVIKKYIFKVTTKGSPLKVTIQTGVDNSDDGFLSEEKKKAINNIQATGIHESTGFNNAEYLYNKAVYDMADTINVMCPNNKINLSLLTGSTYSSFSAVSGAINAPEVFGNTNYWYDSSGSEGVWDQNQLRRQDVYNAIWSHAAYLYETVKVGNVSGWWQNGRQIGTPQCTDFVHTRFYTQYGFDCGYGNGQDIATNTVAMYPDKFTSGSIMGDLTLKAGSIISKRGGDYGHVGFVEAIETDGSGKILSITISDANFTFPGCGGGVRLMCKYTWEQFVQAWGLNCTFAVPIS